MRERPILFSAPMVRALLAGTKTQTRRVVKYQAPDLVDDDGWPLVDRSIDGIGEVRAACPYGQPGDRLWVRESFMPIPLAAAPGPSQTPWSIAYAAGGQTELLAPSSYNPALYNYERWTPSIHMPRWASRITLEVTGVRVERLQDISEADALSEGIERHADGNGFHTEDGMRYSDDPRESFASLWESINGPDSWGANPWVWIVEFKRINP